MQATTLDWTDWGLKTPMVFQALVNDVLRDMLNQFLFIYKDDILIFSETLEKHTEHVRLILQRLLENQLFKVEKCDFQASSVTFRGFVICQGQLALDPAKVRAVKSPTSSSHKQLQRFYFYRRFIQLQLNFLKT